jgi:RHS repeat-associated protein
MSISLLFIGILLFATISPTYGQSCYGYEGTLVDHLKTLFYWAGGYDKEQYPEYLASSGGWDVLALGFSLEPHQTREDLYWINLYCEYRNRSLPPYPYYDPYIWRERGCFEKDKTTDWPYDYEEYGPFPGDLLVDAVRNNGIPWCPDKAGNPINLGTGNKFQQETDFEVKTSGPKLAFRRFYNSQSTYDGPLGYGWTHNYNLFIEDKPIRVIVWDADGRALYFKKQGGGNFTPGRLVYDTLTQEGGGTGDYVLNRKNNIIYRFNSQGRLLSIKDLNDNQITLTYSGDLLTTVTSDFGRSITFTYNQNDKIDTVGDPKGNTYTFSYTGENLTGVTSPDTVLTEYLYGDPNDIYNMTEKRVAGQTAGIWGYDQHDRATSSSKAGGVEAISVDYGDPSASDGIQALVTDSRANERTYRFQSRSGILRVIGIDGGGCSSCPGAERGYYYDRITFALIKITDRNNNKTKFTRDDRGNILTKTEAKGSALERTTTYTYHSTFNLVETITVESVANPGQSKVTTFSYDTDGNLTTKTVTGYSGTTQLQYTTTYGHNSYGQLTQVDGPRTDVSDVTSFSYDPATGNLLSMTQPLVGTTSFAGYDENGNVGTVTDPNGVATSYTCDERNRIKTVTNQADGSTIQLFYDPQGDIDYLVLPEGNIIDCTFDSAGGLTQIEDELGNAIVYSYDSESNKTRQEIRDPSEVVKKYLDFEYDGENRLYKIINPDSAFTQFGYDGNGNPTSLRDPRGNITTYGHDQLNRLIRVARPGGLRISYTYDTHDNLDTVEDANYNYTYYTYDDFGRATENDSPDSGTTTYVYDEAGNLTQKTDANGITVTYSYHAMNRLVSVSFPDPSQNITYSYDSPSVSNGKGRLTGMSDPTGSYTYHYDPKGNLVREEKVIFGIGYTTEYTYDKNNTLTSITSPSGRVVSYGLDAVGRVSGVTTTLNGQSKTVASNINYLPYGGTTALTYGNNIALTKGNDLQYRITSIQAGSAMDRTYGHDENENVTSITDVLDSARNQSFGYDGINQLTSASGIYGQISYFYDYVGNRDWVTKNGQNKFYTYTYGTNRLSRVTGQTVRNFGYDNNGNITSENSRSYTYNQNNRLIQVVENSVTLGDYAYNGLGQRIKKAADGLTTIYHYDRFGNLIAESDDTRTFQVDYIFLNGQPIVKIDISVTEAIYYYHEDHQGTPQVLTDDQSQTVWKADYKPFGDVDISVASVENNCRFPGQYFDHETGLHYNTFRDYHPGVGRYIEPDPIGQAGGDLNLYAYVWNKPTRAYDPWGLWGEDVHSGIGNPNYGTYLWAVQVGFSDAQARKIAIGNDGTDGGFSSWMPMLGLQSRHFNQFIPKRYKDSRDYWAAVELRRAVEYYKEGKCEAALGHLGKGLHSIQDKFAHRDWSTGLFGVDPHPEWYDIWNDPRNKIARELTEKGTKHYLNLYLQLTGQR